ncbi:hypothetical protein OG728_38435 (plasmid) [Streptomyces microflavus]|uniref:hypothetical protein n=1 Tax=Streptomyces microflavus TaxID=1919 RepID=UPI002E13B9F7|nr:hypothetical protein OG728_38435 [Streptomyces microflavus]
MRPTVLFQSILTLGVVIMTMASAVVFVAHGGLSTELAKAVGLLLVFLVFLLVVERRTTGRWFRWNRR